MLDATGKKLLRLLHPDGTPELRRAAIAVLGEIGTREAELGRLLCGLLGDPNPTLRLEALHAVGKLRIEQALPLLLERVTEGGEESEAAAQAAARLGPKGLRGLRELMDRVAPGLRRRIAGALASGGAARAESVAFDSLLDSDPGVVDASARSLLAEIPTLSTGQRKGLVDQLLQMLKPSKKKPLATPSEIALLRLLATANDSRAEALFWERTDSSRPLEVRGAALQALGQLKAAPTRDKFKRLLACAADRDFRVAAPAMVMLRAVPVQPATIPDWISLLSAPDVAVRRLALERLKDHDTQAIALALAAQLHHQDRGLRDEALAQLGRMAHGRQALADALLAADTPDLAWMLARAQAPFVRDYPDKLRKQLLEEAGGYLEAGDRRAEALIYVLREGDPQTLRNQLEERALELRKKKQYPKALLYLKLLGRDPACGPALRFELAACGLKLSEHNLAAEVRATDPALEQFTHLLHGHPEQVLGFVEKAKWLDAKELFYLGFHFAEKSREEKEFGGQVLRLVLKRAGRAQIAKDAKSKLRREGLE